MYPTVSQEPPPSRTLTQLALTKNLYTAPDQDTRASLACSCTPRILA